MNPRTDRRVFSPAAIIFFLGLAAPLQSEPQDLPQNADRNPPAPETLRVPLPDGLVLAGDYLAPMGESAPVLVMFHGLGSSRNEWRPLAGAAARRGWGYAAFDLRGHGDSRRRGDETVFYGDPKHGRNALFWRGMIGDAAEAVRWLEKKKGIGRTRMILTGASLGANIGLNAAVGLGEIPAIVLLSPGEEYAGVSSFPAMGNWSGAALLVASRPDAYAARSVGRLKATSRAPEKTAAWILDGPGPQGPHGAQLFDGALEERILDWVSRVYAPR